MSNTSINQFPILTEQDFIVRAVNPEDASALTDYFCRNRRYLQPWEPTRDEAFFSQFGWQKRSIQLHELFRHNLAFYFVIEHAQLAGICGLVSYSNVTRFPMHACHLGYSLDPLVQKQGVMTRAITLTNQWMFKVQKMHRINACYMPRNSASGAILTRLGFCQEGFAKSYIEINGRWEDHVVTAKLAPEYHLETD